MNLAALAICGAALAGGLVAVSTELPMGMFVALAALPLLTLAEPGASGIGVGELGIAATGVAAAAIAGWLATRRGDRTSRSAETGEALEPAVATRALVLAAAAAVVAGLAAVTPPGTGLDTRGATFGVGLGLAVAAIPLAVLAGARRRLVGVAIGVAGAGLVDRAVGPWTPAVALAGPALGAVVASALTPAVGGRLARAGGRALELDVPTPDRVIERASQLLDRRVLGLAVVGAPLVVGLGALALLLIGPPGAGSTTGVDATVRAVTLLVAVGGIGSGLLAISDAGRGSAWDPAALLPIAAAVPIAGLALRLADPIGGVLLAGVAGIVATAAAGRARSGAIVVVTTLLAGCGLIIGGPGVAAGLEGRGLGTLLVAIAIAGRVGAIPFHRPAADSADGPPAAVLGIVLGWLPSVMAAVVLAGSAGLSIAATGGPTVNAMPAPALDGFEQLIVVGAGLATVLLGALAALIQENVRRSIAYAVVSQAGWLVLAAAAPRATAAAAIDWLPAFGAGSLLLGGVAGLLARDLSRPRIAELSGFGRSNPVALLGVAVALVALVGIPGTPAWAARGAIASASGGSAADVLVGLSVVAVATALGRLLLVGVARGSAAIPAGARQRATDRANLATIASMTGLSVGTLAVALGLLH